MLKCLTHFSSISCSLVINDPSLFLHVSTVGLNCFLTMLISLSNFLYSCYFLSNSVFSNSTFIHSFFFLLWIIFFFLFSLYSSIMLLVPYQYCIFLYALFLSSVAAWHSASNHVPLFAGSMIPSTSSATELMIVLCLSHNFFSSVLFGKCNVI